MNLEACYIYKDIMEDKKTTSEKKDKIKLFSATIPYSIETIRMDEMFPEIPKIFYIEDFDQKQYTKKIINVTFEKNYTIWNADYEWKDVNNNDRKGKRILKASKHKIRKYFYKNGFEIDNVKYVFYKRGSAKAKNGYAFFIQEDMKDKLIQRSRLYMDFINNEELDYTSLLAYESLITSGIEFTIELDPKTEILLIDDIYGIEFDNLSSVTREINNEIITHNETIKIKNCLTDGQGLLDESVFEKYNKSNKGFMLLRSDMFKCCAFNTKLQEWFKANNKYKLTDMFGNEYDATKIKLVTTPNSLKFLKFAYKTSNGDKKECYSHWINNINNIFGVVKCDKQGNYGTYNRTTYQVLNSIPNLTREDLLNVTKIEREYVKLLKSDDVVFRSYLGCDAKAILKMKDAIEEENLELYENTDLLTALLLVNSDIQYTTKFKKLKSELISNYISHLKNGKIRMKDTKYVTLFSNPYEMLLASIGKYKNESIMKGREVCCRYYKAGQDFCATRNPHINAGNIMYTKNKRHLEYNMWFNFTNDICAINFFDNDAPDRLQGCDTDSDVLLLNPNNLLAQKAIYCEENFPTPINRVKGNVKPRKYNINELYKLDKTLSNNYIGRIVNLSQIINSYLNHAIFNNKPEEEINALYQASSKLSSLSQIEIDKSKKIFDNVNMSKELSKIRNMPYIDYVYEKDKNNKMVKKMIVPNFFSLVSDTNDFRVFKKFNTPMDILQDILVFEPMEYTKGKENNKYLLDLLIQPQYIDGKFSINSVNAINKIVSTCGKRINGLKVKTCKLNNNAKYTVKKKSKQEAIKKLSKLKPNVASILYVLRQSFGENINDEYNFKKYGMLTLNLLYQSQKISVLKCFQNKKDCSDEFLVRIKDDYDFNIFGNKYQKITRGELNNIEIGGI
jgi:hypothetical protein